MFAPSGGAGSFNLYDPADMAAGDIDVLIRLIAGGRIYTNGIAGEIVIQTGAGPPSHSATEGTLYWDTVADVLYCNNNGSTGWTAVGSSSSGSVGPAGMPGYDGEAGLDGFPGPTGAAGATGSTGATGAAGAAGAAGPPGYDGVDGADGLDGPPGVTGAQGATGATGGTGATGPAGAVGQPGMDGLDGVEGMEGIPGASGASGAIGPMGPPGMDALPADELLLGLPGIPTPPVPLSEITITIPAPVNGDDWVIRTFKLATTLYEVTSTIQGAGTGVVFNLYHGADLSAAGTKALTSDVTEASKTAGTTTGGASWADDTMVAGAHLRVKIGTVTGAITQITLTVRYYLT